ncbi:hypothetical protein MJO29_015961 [Puccinia striiformis f. sp. tritici]|nr:hypothetical protein MJO29_015961 [Puccinia striiformis f. sp. tritici]
MVPTLVVTSIGAGWQPRRNTDVSLADPASGNPTASTTRLWCDQVEVHPDTDVDNMGASRHKPKVNPPDSPVSTRQIGYENDENTKTP